MGRRLNYQEGTWFALLLRSTGYAVGVVARLSGDGPAFGYFFGPWRSKLPSADEVLRLSAEDAIWVGRFGDLGLLRKGWPIICHSDQWDRTAWPLPPFVRVDEHTGRATRTYYNDELQFMGEVDCEVPVSEYVRDALAGYGAVKRRLTKMLDDA